MNDSPLTIDPTLLRTLVGQGQVYDLSQPIAPGMPVLGIHPPYTFTPRAAARRRGAARQARRRPTSYW